MTCRMIHLISPRWLEHTLLRANAHTLKGCTLKPQRIHSCLTYHMRLPQTRKECTNDNHDNGLAFTRRLFRLWFNHQFVNSTLRQGLPGYSLYPED